MTTSEHQPIVTSDLALEEYDRLIYWDDIFCKLIKCTTSDEFISTVESLIGLGMSISDTCDDGSSKETLLHFLVKSDSSEKTKSAQYLLCKGADINALNVDLNTPLHFALFMSGTPVDVSLVNLLIENGAHLNLVNANNYSPLTVAIYNWNSRNVSRLLIVNGAQCNIPHVYKAFQWWLCHGDVADIGLINFLFENGLHRAIDKRRVDHQEGCNQGPYTQPDELEAKLLDTRYKLTEEVKQLVLCYLCQPPSLLTLTRITIRNVLMSLSDNRTIVPRVRKLPVPDSIIAFMLFE